MTGTDSPRWQSPKAWLYAWDFARDRARFLHVDREALARSSFLDHRISANAANPEEVPIAEILAEPIRATVSAPPGLVFHSAFCCSTLFARSLDLPGRSLVLREPAALLQLADLKRGLTVAQRSTNSLLAPTLDLLTRPFAPGERVILKPSNVVNNLAADILAWRPGAHALLLYDELEPFLLAVLKRPRESARGIDQFLKRLLADPIGLTWAETHAVPEMLAERAALAWALQIFHLREFLAGDQTGCLRVLGAGELLADPPAALASGAAWLGLDLSRQEAAGIAKGPLWAHHAKDPGIAYTPAQRQEDQALARRLLAVPVRAGIRYAERTLDIGNADFSRKSALLP